MSSSSAGGDRRHPERRERQVDVDIAPSPGPDVGDGSAEKQLPPAFQQTSMQGYPVDTHQPRHHVPAPMVEQRLLRDVEQRLLDHFCGDVPAGRIIRMVYGTARLLRSAGISSQPLADQVEAACRAALTQISRTSS